MENTNKKVVLVGHFGVGKTSLINRFVHSRFSEEYLSTIGVKIDKKVVETAGRTVTLLIWDIAGEVHLKKITESYLLGTSGVIYVFDVSRPKTYQSIDEDIKLYMDKLAPGTPLLVIGNKADLADPLILEEIKSKLPVHVNYFSSAKDAHNVEDIFTDITQKMIL